MDDDNNSNNDHTIKKPDTTQGTCFLVDISVLTDGNVAKEGAEKSLKHRHRSKYSAEKSLKHRHRSKYSAEKEGEDNSYSH
jgi:hypothetical protein